MGAVQARWGAARDGAVSACWSETRRAEEASRGWPVTGSGGAGARERRWGLREPTVTAHAGLTENQWPLVEFGD